MIVLAVFSLLFLATAGVYFFKTLIAVIKPFISGWPWVPYAFRTNAVPKGKSLGLQTVEVGYADKFRIPHKSTVLVHISSEYLFLEYIGVLGCFYPRLRLPIEAMQIERFETIFPDTVKVELDEKSCPNFYFSNPVSKGLLQAQLKHAEVFG